MGTKTSHKSSKEAKAKDSSKKAKDRSRDGRAKDGRAKEGKPKEAKAKEAKAKEAKAKDGREKEPEPQKRLREEPSVEEQEPKVRGANSAGIPRAARAKRVRRDGDPLGVTTAAQPPHSASSAVGAAGEAAPQPRQEPAEAMARAAAGPNGITGSERPSKEGPGHAARPPRDERVDKAAKAAKPRKAERLAREEKDERAERRQERRLRTEESLPGPAAERSRAEEPRKGERSRLLEGRTATAPRAAPPAREERREEHRGPCAAMALDVGASSAGSSAISGSSCSSSGSRSGSRRRRSRPRARRDMTAGIGGLGFSAPLEPPPPAPPPPVPATTEAPGASEARAAGPLAYGPALQNTQLAVLPAKVQGLLDNRESLAQEVLRARLALEAHASQSAVSKEDPREEGRETVVRMPPRLHESLLHPDNEPRLLARTGLAAAGLNEDGLVILRANSQKALTKALGQLRRVAYHCQWGCSKAKVSALLAEKPAKPVHTMVLRLAATSSRLQSHEAKLTLKVRKLRIGTQASTCQLVVDGIPGLSRKHCTITFEPEKGSCYVQDLSTNGTYLNGKRLPRPPYKNPQDARVRLFHGDEMFFRLRSEDMEELGYVVNLFELS